MPDDTIDFANGYPDTPDASTEGFWLDQLLHQPMESARNEQEWKKAQDDYYDSIEKEHGMEERPDDWAVKGTKRGSLDKMQKDMPPYYPVPGDVLKDPTYGDPGDRPWMKPEQQQHPPNPYQEISASDEDLPPRFQSQADAQGGDDDPGWSVGEDKGATEQFWTDTLLHGEMPAGDQPESEKQPNIYNIGPGTRDWNPIIHGSEDTGPQQFKFKRQGAPPLGLDYTELTWDDFPLA